MIVVGCGKAKAAEPRPARDLYTGSLFRAARRVAEASGQRWVILSAAFGIIDPEEWLAPYERTLDYRSRCLREWAAVAAFEIDRRRARPTETVEILAGSSYATPLAEALSARGIGSTAPLRGLGTGHRLQRLSHMAETLHQLRAESRWQEGKEEMSKLDIETVKYIRDEARDDGDEAVARACTRALEGDAASIAVVEETIRNRVGRAHTAHCQRGQASRLTFG